MSNQDNNIYITVRGKTKLFAKAPEVLKNELDIQLARELNAAAGRLRAYLREEEPLLPADLYNAENLMLRAADTILRLSGYTFPLKKI